MNDILTAALSFIAFGTVGFWCVLGAITIAVIALIENEHEVWPALLLGGCIALYWHDIKALDLHFGQIIGMFTLYIFIGSCWSLFRWKQHVDKNVEEIIKEDLHERYSTSRLSPSYHKSEITSWIVYWPWSAFWQLSGNFFNNLFALLVGFYTKITASGEARIQASLQQRKEKRKQSDANDR